MNIFFHNYSEFSKRFFTILVLLPTFLICFLFLNNILWGILLIPILYLCSREWIFLNKFSKRQKFFFLFINLFLPIITIYFLYFNFFVEDIFQLFSKILLLSVLFWLFFSPIILYFKIKISSSYFNFILGLFLLFSTWLSLFLVQEYKLLGIYFLALVWSLDIFSYIFGSIFGKNKLAPTISPKKTYEGLIGGILASVVLFSCINFFYSFNLFELKQHMTLFIFLFIYLAIIGDLFESWIKRTNNIKDSGNILPGHGGILDRVDSICSSLPLPVFLIISG